MLRRKRSVSFGGFGWIDKSTVSALRARKQELLTISNVPVTDCPPSPPRTAPPTMKSAHFFDMMDKMEQVPEAAEMKTIPQRQKDDYIPYPRIEEVLERGGPYPQVILPEFGGYWIEDPEAPPPPAPPPTSLEIPLEEEEEEEEDRAPGHYGYRLEEISEAARAYRKHFLGRVRESESRSEPLEISRQSLRPALVLWLIRAPLWFWLWLIRARSQQSMLKPLFLAASQQVWKPAAVCEHEEEKDQEVRSDCYHQVPYNTAPVNPLVSTVCGPPSGSSDRFEDSGLVLLPAPCQVSDEEAIYHRLVTERSWPENAQLYPELRQRIKAERAMRGRSVSMETMSRGGAGLPTSLSGGGLAHISPEYNVKSPVKRRSGLFPRLLSVDSQTEKHNQRSLLSEQRSFDSCHPTLEVRSELPSNPSSPEAGQRVDRTHVKKESSKISRSTSSTCSFSIPADDTHLLAQAALIEGQSSSPLIVCRSPTETKNKNSPRSNLKFRFDKLSHSAAQGH
ncbi:rap1 GTPase-activating protein 2-like [Morone saxatilis]|uniref:rap1 GTPase-activating protein 2-like n=1 Tax=Morone saxatilis TaxID=34816 RepID=UPI0015E22AF8|nr:rap1 GTPase-activating protein 2-like [Morone saxatilis]